MLARLALFVGLTGCAAHYPGPLGPVGRLPEPREAHEAPAAQPDPEAVAEVPSDDRVLRAAQYFLKHKPIGFRDDCSGYVCAVYNRAGYPLEGNTALLWERARAAGAVHHRKVPSPGDLAFFDDTYDRDRDGRVNDELTHVALVLEVGADGTILLAHGGTGQGRTTMVMNLRRPDVRRDEAGAEINDYLRVRRDSDPAGAKYLSGELWRGFATVREQDLSKWVADAG